jgi:hypothetical protein
MKHWALSKKCGVALFCIGLTAPLAMADDDERQSVTVAFGRGLNTAQTGNIVNHAILPNDIKINQGGVVHFLVAGFHEPVVFVPGVSHDDIMKIANGGTSTFIFDPTNPAPTGAFYFGINPAGGPLNTPATPVVPGDTRSNAQNRVESVGFPAAEGTGNPPSPIAEPGVYLVICNVRQHFQNGQFGFVKVKAQGD